MEDQAGEGNGVVAAAQELTCERDGTPTRLTCANCREPICPLCLVRTPVGMKCPTCGTEPGSGAGRRGAGRRRPRVIGAVGAGAAVVLVGLAVAVPRLLSPEKPAVRATVNPAAEARPGAPYTFGGLGREVIDGDLSFTVASVDCGATQVVGETTRTAQGKFCVMALSIRNRSRSAATFEARNQRLADSANRRYEPDPGATAAHPANAGRDLLSPVVNPGNELRGVLVFDVPPDITPATVSLHSRPTGTGAIVGLVS